MGSDWDGRRYDEVNALQRWVADQSLASLELRGDERVLDVGCGDGRVTAEVAGLVPTGSVLGVDPSPRMLDVARGRVGSGSGALAFETGAAETMSFVAAFDVVVSFNALHWVADLGEAFRRIRTALVTGGSACLQLVCDGDRPSVEDVTLAVTRRPPYDAWLRHVPPPYHHRDPGEIVELARAAGLDMVDQRVDDLAWDFGAPDDLRAWLAVGFADWLRPLPEEHREPLLAEAAADYAAVVGSPSVVRFLQLRSRFVAR